MALYPPIIASSMPAFDINSNQVKIYFTLSPYNTTNLTNITAQVSVRHQGSNVSVVNSSSQILTDKKIHQDDIDEQLNRYYVSIYQDTDIKDGKFTVDTLYKVQVRLYNGTQITTGAIDQSFTTNVNAYSEWSTVCIIKGIKPPTFYIDEFHVQGIEASDDDTNEFSYDIADFNGVYKPGNDSSQTLKYWRLRLLESSYTDEDILDIDDFTYSDSGLKAVSAYNYTLNSSALVIECSLPYDFYSASTENNLSSYKLLFEIITKNDYTDSHLYSFTYTHIADDKDLTNAILQTYANQQEGYIKLHVDLNGVSSEPQNYVIRRTDSKSNFNKWEDLLNFKLGGNNNVRDYYDFTVESGLLYQYCVQHRDTRGRRSTPRKTQILLVQWNHSYLLQSNLNGAIDTSKQLKLKYDFQISSYKTNISENKTDTIGGQYPYIRRNGNMYYRSFQCTGTISNLMDNASLLTTKSNMLESHKVDYDELMGLNEDFPDASSKYNYTYERKFRQQVQKFLYNVKPKLYKSTQEGNILIKLMDVSLTPKTELGRLIYTFSATAYEIDEATIPNFDKYGIINIGTYDTSLGQWQANEWPIYVQQDDEIVQVDDYDFIGQITSITEDSFSGDQFTGNLFKANQDIIGTDKAQSASSNSIATLNNYGMTDQNNRILSKIKIKSFKIEVESQPYLIINDENGKLSPVDDKSSKRHDLPPEGDPGPSPTIIKKLYQMESTYLNSTATAGVVDYYLGTLFTINGQQVLIAPPNNIYQVKDQNLSSLSIIPARDTAMSLSYVIQKYTQEDPTTTAKIKRNNKINAYLEDKFEPFNDVINTIKAYYKQNYQSEDLSRVERKLIGVRSIKVDAEPGVSFLIYAQKKSDTDAGAERPVKPQLVTVNETGQIEYDLTDSDDIYIVKMQFIGMRILKEETKEISVENKDYAVDFNVCENQIYYRGQWYNIINNTQSNVFDNDNDAYDTFYYFQCPINALVYYFAIEEEDYY